MEGVSFIDISSERSDVEFYENGIMILSGGGPVKGGEVPQCRPTKRLKIAKKQVPLVNVRVNSGSIEQQSFFNEVKVMLEYNQIEGHDILVVLWEGVRIFKIQLKLEERLRELFTIVHHKCLESQVLSVNNSVKNVKNKKNSHANNNTKRLISKLYKDVISSDIRLSYSDPHVWQITFDFSLLYIPQSINKFSKETCSFLDRMFSRGRCDTSHSNLENSSPFIQQNFVKQTISYTKSSVDSKESTVTKVDGLKVHLLPFQSKSVSWMFDKERKCFPDIDLNNALQALSFLNDYVSYGYEMISPTCFWNKFTNFILTLSDLKEIYNRFTSVQKQQNAIGCRGLLSEEMGLGKTIEILALILKNKRSVCQDNTFIDNDGKTIYKTKTSLIICPNAILQQWINEIENHTTENLKIFHYKGFLHVKKYFNCENIQEIVKTLSNCDIIITSYNVVSTEIHYAEYNASLRPRRKISPIKYDYSSPLSLMQFFRIILDEVQMLHSDSTKAAKCTSLLHRVHTWGVSGTPIQLVRDYQTALSYLKISPFFELPEIISTINLNVIYKRNQLINGIAFSLKELMNFFIERNLCIRHSKKDVFEQIQVPKQHNYIIPLEFAPVEWDNYLDLWNCFLEASGYHPNGSGSTRLSSAQLNQWLTRLRYLCCHAVFPDQNYNQKNNQNSNINSGSNSLLNIDDVLKLMTSEAIEKLDSLYRDNYQIQIKSAQAKMELQNKPMEAIGALNSIKQSLINDLKVKCNVDDPFNTNALSEDKNIPDATNQRLENNSRMRTRAYLDLLHQCYFFVATGYYLMGSNRLEQLDHENEKLTLMKTDVKPKTYVEFFSEEDMKSIEENQQFEQQYYTYAEKLRERILLGRVQKVEIIISETNVLFMDVNEVAESTHHSRELKIIQFHEEEDFSSNILVSRCFKMLASLISSLNKQAHQFNTLFEELEQLLYKPIRKEYNEDNEEEKANEYATSIDDQDKMFAIFACLEQLLSNRDLILTSDEIVKNPKKALKPQPGQQFSEFHSKLISKLNVINGSPMKQVFDDLKNSRIVRNVSGTTGGAKNVDDFENYLLAYEDKMSDMTKENNVLRDSLKKLNNIYNAKLEYYSHLQKISDSLVSLLHMETPARNLILKAVRDGTQNQKYLERIGTAESRVKYLNSLNALKEGIVMKKSFHCPICLGTIHMGAMIKCGHFFCRTCIGNWLKRHTTCPMCKTSASLTEAYNFKFQNEDKDEFMKDKTLEKNVQKMANKNMEPTTNDSEQVFEEKYSRYPRLKEVHQMRIKESFGAKIDFVIKLILFLKMKSEANNEDPPQIVLYSQSFDYLRVISKVLHIHDISQLTCWANIASIGETISKYKKDNTITCILLNVRALGAGLNLLNARHVFLLDPIINQGDELQAMSRNNRIGQTQETYVWNFMIRNTVEENILKYKCVLESKKRLIEGNKEIQQSMDDCIEADEDRKEFEMNESTGEQVAGKHLWHCFFQNTEQVTS
ncbi:hypothetical protein HG535_0B04460 [Zygotorulaspora mrakii]|uniref:RING-type domain-containing protein n=1 Tax=Zygotorulaspora mrakii TaxID=42260 RepID=A0A7H9AZ37_ZYGMR|nr:uncharacterized protein HG535_0B04460 [Zygotorulaspora mrakii]QLG71404.1 hypothetical protein HG535_0B04460 [Zygotorulaspora mrakii]